MDIYSFGFLGLIGFGTVNVISFFKPDLDSRLKFALSFIVAFGFSFIPAELGNMLLNHAKQAIEVSLAFSAVSKIASKAGGK